ncbi:hypothetical protein MRX96_004648 [Rhipicephalus microplus]
MAEHKCIPWVYVVELFWVSASTCTLPAAAACSELFETTFVFIVARYLKLPPHKILKAEDETFTATAEPQRTAEVEPTLEALVVVGKLEPISAQLGDTLTTLSSRS